MMFQIWMKVSVLLVYVCMCLKDQLRDWLRKLVAQNSLLQYEQTDHVGCRRSQAGT